MAAGNPAVAVRRQPDVPVLMATGLLLAREART
jgi:hypothetical protein